MAKSAPDPAQLPTLVTGAAPAAAAADPLIGERIGQYRVLRELGRGGMGVVYEVRHEGIGQRAAAKTLNPEYSADPLLVERFHTEARAAAAIKHPGLVKLFDFGLISPTGPLFILMEFLEGESLVSRLRRESRLTELAATRLGRQVASAMVAAHAAGVIHRDLKPDNIFIVPDPEAAGGERAKVLDFGLARMSDGQIKSPARGRAVRDRELTAAGTIMGTPGYMAPEQCDGMSRVDAKADVYALGVILFEALAGRPLFESADPSALLRMHMLRPPPKLDKESRLVSAELAAIVDRMLRKTPAERPSMFEVETALAAHDPSRAGAPEPRLKSSPGRKFLALPPRVRYGVIGAVLVGLLAAFFGRHAYLSWRGLPPVAMRAIPSGTYFMGSTADEAEAAYQWCLRLVSDGCVKTQFAREYPSRQISVSAFELDETEVDNAHFAAWLNSSPGLRFDADKKLVFAGKKLMADLFTQYGQSGLAYIDEQYVSLRGLERRPAVQVTWDAAEGYCRGQGKRLPTEAEWEYAARSGSSQSFPWGDDEPRCDGVVYARNQRWACGHLSAGSMDVGIGEQDVSVQGVRGLAGNVSEWVADRFVGRLPVCQPVCRDPRVDTIAADEKGDPRVVRGGDWNTSAATCRAASRSRIPHDKPTANVGFRCARSSE